MAQLAFDASYYLQQNPDVAAAISRGQFTSAQQHYDLFGRFESRNPSAYFNTSFYLSEYPDVARAGVNPLTHFLTFGLKEGRIANGSTDALIDSNGNGIADEFNADAYLKAYGDVKAAVDAGQTTAYKHFIEFGQFEGRTATLTNGTTITGPLGNTGAGGSIFALTAGADSFTGTAGNDTFNAFDVSSSGSPVSTLTVGDTLNGGAGNDTLNITQAASFTQIPVGVSVSNIENVNVTSGGTVTINTATGFSGLTNLNTTSVGNNTVTAASTTAVTATATTNGNIAVNGGSNVTANALANTGGTITIGGTTAPAGAVVVNSTIGSTGGSTGGNIAVTGGTTVTVNETASNAVNTTTTAGNVLVTGTAITTAVTVNQSAAATASSTVAGFVNGTVGIADANAASGTAAGTIASVTLNNYGTSTIDSSALTSVSLSGIGGTLGIGRGALTATPTANTLALNVSGLTAGTITDSEAAADDGFQTLNIASTGTASTIAGLNAVDAKAINISGDAALTIGTTSTSLTALETITVTNTAGLTLNPTLSNNVTFTGGAGADKITLGATTKTITLGAGNDTVTATAALGTGGSVAGGDGTDRLITTATLLSSATEGAKYTGFETLQVTDGTADLSYISGITAIELNGATAGATNLSAAQAANVSILSSGAYTLGLTGASTVGQLDALTVTVDDGASTTGNVTVSSLTAAGVETVNLVTNENVTVSSLTGLAQLTNLVVTGAGNTSITTGALAVNVNTVVDASAHTGTFLFNASGATTNGLSITGSSTAVNTITGSDQADVITGGSANDTLNGGAGNDTIRAGNGNNTISGGAGNDAITAGSGNNTITDTAGTNTITVGSGNNTITGGSGVDTITVGNGTNTITGGVGADTINLGTGVNTITINTGDSIVTAFDTITGLKLGTGTGHDILSFQNAGATAATVVALTTAQQTSVSGEASLSAAVNAVATIASADGATTQFTYGSDTYIFHNGDGNATFDASADHIVKVTGVTGTLAVADITTYN